MHRPQAAGCLDLCPAAHSQSGDEASVVPQEGARLVAAAKQQEAEERAAQIAKIEAGRDLMATVIAGMCLPQQAVLPGVVSSHGLPGPWAAAAPSPAAVAAMCCHAEP